MAMYISKYRCQDCGERFFKYIDSTETGDPQPCRACGKDADWIPKVQPPAVMSDIAPYKSQQTGEMITSRGQHRAHMREHKLIEVGTENLEKHISKPDNSADIKNRKQAVADAVYGRTK